MPVEEYCAKFGIQEIDLQSMSNRKRNSEMQKKAVAEGRLHGWGKGDANPSRRQEVREGRKSIFSMNYEGYDGLTDEEKRAKIEQIHKTLAEEKAKNGNNPLTLEYYIKRGCTEEEARQKLKDRQATFTYEKCVQRHGEEEGKKIFEARQEKWQKTLNDKPQEEIERINKAKMNNGKGWSKISQELFRRIEENLKGRYSNIYYATNGHEGEHGNNEFMVMVPDTGKHFFLDFYVEDVNKVIEFDGDYWHGEGRGNVERDKLRDQNLIDLGFTEILHVKERDFKADPEKVIAECVAFVDKRV